MMNRKKLRGKAANKRFDHKRQRAAERQVLEGGGYKDVRSNIWSVRLDQPPLLDGVSTAPSKRSKQESDHWCPAREGRKRHEYLEDIEVIERPLWFPYPGWEKYYPQERKIKICVHCGKNGRPPRKGGKHYF